MKYLFLIAVLFIQGCALLDYFKPSSGLSVDTEIVVGDKEEEINTEVVGNKEITHNTADTIANTYQTMNEQAPWWVMILLILGWLLPMPSQMWRGLVSLLPWKGRG